MKSRYQFELGYAPDNFDSVCHKKDAHTVMWLVKMRFIAMNGDAIIDKYDDLLNSDEFEDIVGEYWEYICWNNHGNECAPSEIDYRALMDDFMGGNGWMDELREEIRENGDGWGIEELLARAEELRAEFLRDLVKEGA